MERIDSASRLPPGTAAAIGAFDGLHRGHMALFERAASVGDRVALVTFVPHPLEVLAPARAPARLQTERQRMAVAAAMGIDVFVALPFTPAVSELSPRDFAGQYLQAGLEPSAVVVGQDFRFGSARAGDVDTLRALLEPATRVEVVPQVSEGDRKVGSSAIRNCVAEGSVARGAELLGRYYAVEGVVERGDGRGRGLGFATANVGAVATLLPAHGVYATALRVHDGPHAGALFLSVTNLGHNPTFGGTAETRLEVHCIDEDLGESLYGCHVEVAFVARLRDEQTFDGAEALTRAIETDVANANAALENFEPEGAPPLRTEAGTA